MRLQDKKVDIFENFEDADFFVFNYLAITLDKLARM